MPPSGSLIDERSCRQLPEHDSVVEVSMVGALHSWRIKMINSKKDNVSLQENDG